MKTRTIFSKIQGKKDDLKFHSVSEFCRIVANDTKSDLYGYFLNFYAAYIADTNSLEKGEKESSEDFKNRVIRYSFSTAKSTPTKKLQESELHQIFSSKNQLFKLLNHILPCYYDEEMKHHFAKVRIIARNVSNLRLQDILDLKDLGHKEFTLEIPTGVNDKFPKGKKVTLITKNFSTDKGVYSEELTKGNFYNKLDEERKQRKTKFSELAKTGIYFFDDKDNICTLVDNDKMNFENLYTVISEYSQKENYNRVQTEREKQKKENQQKKELAANKKFDEEIAKNFNKLLKYRNEITKEFSNSYIIDSEKRNKVSCDFIKLITDYKLSCKRRFLNWNENENEFLKDTLLILHNLTTEPKQKETVMPENKENQKKTRTRRNKQQKETAAKAA